MISSRCSLVSTEMFRLTCPLDRVHETIDCVLTFNLTCSFPSSSNKRKTSRNCGIGWAGWALVRICLPLALLWVMTAPEGIPERFIDRMKHVWRVTRYREAPEMEHRHTRALPSKAFHVSARYRW